MICASPGLDASPSFIHEGLSFSASLALGLGFLVGLSLWHLPLQPSSILLPPSVSETSRLPMYIVNSHREQINQIDPYFTPVHGLNEFISNFSDFVAQMWPYSPHTLHFFLQLYDHRLKLLSLIYIYPTQTASVYTREAGIIDENRIYFAILL